MKWRRREDDLPGAESDLVATTSRVGVGRHLKKKKSEEAELWSEELTGVLESDSVGDIASSTSTSSGKETTVLGTITLS